MSLMGLIPPIGLEIPCSGYGVNIPLQVNVLGIVTLDFKGGIKYRIEANLGAGLGGVKMKVIGYEQSADSPVLGKVTFSQADVDTTPLSLLELTKTLPPTFRQTTYLDIRVTIEKPPGGGPPLVLMNTKPLTLVNDSLTVFPPQGSVYQLQAPVDLSPVGNPNQVVATLLQFPTTWSHNP
ncbi:hypothetical protein [Hyalangium minutum]|uniref:Uncharacterized protein n=1 Tax=Hyalangium minutum TaxID=394096 RepID=A0A085WNH8_9BACT|nr:hypothetical protein [Hyalangium minutum]KFE69241.1 hypothetical protein DB31_7143 [Hyalangium minutum]